MINVDKETLSKASGYVNITVGPSADEKEKMKVAQVGLELCEVMGDGKGKLFLSTGKINEAVTAMLDSLGFLAAIAPSRKVASSVKGEYTVKSVGSENRLTVYVFDKEKIAIAYAKKLVNNEQNKFADYNILVSVCEVALK